MTENATLTKNSDDEQGFLRLLAAVEPKDFDDVMRELLAISQAAKA